jgi:uncharacterized protein YndB with AHSA1/START domain
MTTTTGTTAFVAADPDTVFGLLIDVDRLPEWNQIITRVLHRPAEIAPGAEWVVEMHAMGQTWPSRTRVEAIDRTDRRLVHRSGTDDANPSFTTWHWHVRAHPHGSQVSVAGSSTRGLSGVATSSSTCAAAPSPAKSQRRSGRSKPPPGATPPSPHADRPSYARA